MIMDNRPTSTSTGIGQSMDYVFRTYGLGNWPPRRVVHPPKARVYKLVFEDDDDLLSWHWAVGHYEDTVFGGRSHVATRWGQCTRWDDCLEIALAMQMKEQAAYWARIIARADAAGIVLPDE